jgi:ATP-dependent RNA helicase SUPV3L1/SUV3
MAPTTNSLIPAPRSRVTALLGPTNTGKTHFAVERMVAHESGIIGLPLRLLAREIYDRVAAMKGANAVALITGEERIRPPTARYFVSTVESMPLDVDAEFVAVDEIQMAADYERGHVFTDRLLNARGRSETLFMGSDVIRGLIKRLVPGIEIVSRPRFSKLSYSGAKKLARLPPRTAIVAFSADEVYAIAEYVRRSHGGAAVVMGALSPRTRNAQVAMFEDGEVDYLVATDAIGMGLNLNVRHVAFAGLAKFDGRRTRMLSAIEVGQIAGRSGRHMNDGTFGTTGDAPLIDPEVIEQVEAHCLQGLRKLQFRSTRLDLSSVPGLITSLQAPPPDTCLTRTFESEDMYALKSLYADPEIATAARSPVNVPLLWEVCRIPDFRKSLPEAHVQLLGHIFRFLINDGKLSPDWLAPQLARLDQTTGDIDALSQRLSYIRTWAYVSHRADWLADPIHWQERTREIENRLSDALHQRLTQRFVDRRSSALRRKLKDEGAWHATVSEDGEVLVEGHDVGRLRGFRFIAADLSALTEGRALRAAAKSAINKVITERAFALCAAPDDAIQISHEGRIEWRGEMVAELKAGTLALEPRVNLVRADLLYGKPRQHALERLAHWVSRHVEKGLGPLVRLTRTARLGAARGLAFHLEESLGIVPLAHVADLVAALRPGERTKFVRQGVRFGAAFVFLPAMLKPSRAGLRLSLWAIHRGVMAPPSDLAGAVSTDNRSDVPTGYFEALGYSVIGTRAYRIDMLERLGVEAASRSKKGVFPSDPKLLSMVGCGRDQIGEILGTLGYRPRGKNESGETVFGAPKKPKYKSKPKSRSSKPQSQSKPKVDLNSPFAVLQNLDVAKPKAKRKRRRRKNQNQSGQQGVKRDRQVKRDRPA